MHRGRIQSQGGGLEDSKPWAQPGALAHASGVRMSVALEAQPSSKERKLRAKAYAAARKFMDAAKTAGGVGRTSKTYMVKGDPHRRVDIEVQLGIAFK